TTRASSTCASRRSDRSSARPSARSSWRAVSPRATDTPARPGIMDAAMATTRPAPALRRDTRHRVLGGVCAGLGRHMGVDPLIVRVAFIAAAVAGGIGIALYALAWVLVPAGDAPDAVAPRRTSRGT